MTTQEMTGGDTLQTEPQAGTPVEVTASDFKEECFVLRGDIESIKTRTQCLKGHQAFDEGEPIGSNKLSEMKANIQLAYRHLEDARMRIGKAVQAYDGGKSCYPR